MEWGGNGRWGQNALESDRSLKNPLYTIENISSKNSSNDKHGITKAN